MQNSPLHTIDQAAIEKPGNVFVMVSLDGQQKEKLQLFEESITTVPEVMECYLMAGEFDYLMRVIFKDSADFMRTHGRLTGLPGVLRVQSAFTLKTVHHTTELPLGNK